MDKPQYNGSSPALSIAPVCRDDTNPVQSRGAKSFVDDLGLSRGVVSSRAAFSLRSIETKPFDWEICSLQKNTSPGFCSVGRRGQQWSPSHALVVCDVYFLQVTDFSGPSVSLRRAGTSFIL